LLILSHNLLSATSVCYLKSLVPTAV